MASWLGDTLPSTPPRGGPRLIDSWDFGPGLVAPDPRGRLRLLQLDKLLTPELRDLLAVYYFTQTLEADAV